MNYYFTFGIGQVNEGCYYVVENTTFDIARERMFEVFGEKWGFQYSEDEWLDERGVSQAIKYGYKQIK